jgi:hypothetical protein
VQVERRALDQAGRRIGAGEHRHGPRLDDEGERGSAEHDEEKSGGKRQERGRLAAMALKTAWTISLGLPLMRLSDVGVHQQSDQEDSTQDRTASSSLSVDSAMNCAATQRPVGRRDQRATLQSGLQSRGMRHRTAPVYLCGILLYEWLASFRAIGRSARAG